MRSSNTALSCMLFILALQAILPVPSASLEVGFYNYKCKGTNVELTVKKVVAKAIYENPGTGAGLIRMFFHDCFVRGCDASVLLDSTPGNPAEKTSVANFPSLRGFEVIDQAKAELESRCPGVVSCADIIAFAARDASYLLGRINYAIPSGRLDGLISNQSDVLANLPAPFFNISQNEASYARKGMSVEDMVTLSGAHSIGRSHCTTIEGRLFPTPDPTMDPSFASTLEGECPQNANANSVVPLDVVTPNVLDNQYYKNVKAHKVLFTTDQDLLTRPDTAAMVDDNARNQKAWKKKFAAAMVKMGFIPMPTGAQGEIRKNCHFVNQIYK